MYFRFITAELLHNEKYLNIVHMYVNYKNIKAFLEEITEFQQKYNKNYFQQFMSYILHFNTKFEHDQTICYF